MACLNESASSVPELLRKIVSFLIDAANFDIGKNWVLMSPESIDAIDNNVGIILKGVGDGDDEVYVGMKAVPYGTAGQVDIVLNGYAGYDAGLSWEEQPGCIYLANLPTVPLVAETLLTFWLSANTRRFVFVVELSTQYESCYLGLMNPIAIENQYPYPLMVGGSGYRGLAWTDMSTSHSAFMCPAPTGSSSMCIRRPDGSWRYGNNQQLGDLCVWPTNISPVNTLTVLDDLLTLENVILYPMYLYENNPVGMVAQFDGVYWIGNRSDISTKDTVIYQDKNYKVFNNVSRRDNDSYFTIEWW